MAICGGGDVDQVEGLTKIPLFVAHGSDDRLVPVERSRHMVNAIWNTGGNKVVYREFPGVGHDVWNNVFADVTSWDWLFRHKGKPFRLPKRFFPVPKIFPWQSRLF